MTGSLRGVPIIYYKLYTSRSNKILYWFI